MDARAVPQSGQPWSDTVAQALALVVSKCTELSQPSDICSLLMTSSTIRAALQQCRGHMLIDVLWDDDETHHTEIRKLTGFAVWLPQHAGLVSAVQLGSDHILHNEHLQQDILQLGLAACQAAQAAATAAGAAAGAAAAQVPAGQPLPLPLRLQKVSVDFLPRGPILERLAAARLRWLQVAGNELSAHVPTARSQAAFGQLTALRDLHLDGRIEEPIPAGLAAALAQLTQLTKLEAEPMLPDQVQYLPTSLVRLCVKVHSEVLDDPYALDLCNLSRLQQLLVGNVDEEIAAECRDLVLPAQLTWLNLGVSVQQLHGGTNVRRVKLEGFDGSNFGALRALSRLQQPWSLDVQLSHWAASRAGVARILGAAIGAAQHLTKLHVEKPQVGVPGGEPYVGLCGPVSQLPRLNRLLLSHMSVPRAELLQLTCLTGLTGLGLLNIGGVDDVVAVSLVLGMPGLRELALRGSGLQSLGFLSAVATLRSLESLDLTGGLNFAVGDFELQQLSVLTRLTFLHLRGHQCTQSGMQQFLAQMPRLAVVHGPPRG